ncbi:MAG TPA: GGDEF domain-containing protein, partial [Candidatus Polarisedimenticolia bacterium]|nr:GGDEF domain-containing protein [Candidatus Polarisedimenticolia bacterium]
GLPGHRVFHEFLDREFRRARRYSTPLSLIMCDIDRFRAVNDLHGHAAGDRMLQEIARGLGSRLRDVDMAARYGGEEFALVLPGADAASASRVAERARLFIESAASGAGDPLAPPAAGERVRVTASLGVATYPTEAAATHVLLLACAEAALRRAKDEGRNRVVIHDGRVGATGANAPAPSAPPLPPDARQTGTWSG